MWAHTRTPVMLCNLTSEVQEHWAASALPVDNQQKIDNTCMSINHLIDLSLIFKIKNGLKPVFWIILIIILILSTKVFKKIAAIFNQVFTQAVAQKKSESPLISKILCTFKFKSWSHYIINRSVQASTVRSNLHTYDGLASIWNKYSCAR